MGGFKFRLERVLNVRELQEEQAKFKWAAEEQLAQEERVKLEQLREKARQIKQFGYEHQEIAVRQAMYAYLEVLSGKIEDQKQRVQEQEQAAALAKEAWFKARQETEKVSILREQQYAAFVREELQKEQKMLDDMAAKVKI